MIRAVLRLEVEQIVFLYILHKDIQVQGGALQTIRKKGLIARAFMRVGENFVSSFRSKYAVFSTRNILIRSTRCGCCWNCFWEGWIFCQYPAKVKNNSQSRSTWRYPRSSFKLEMEVEMFLHGSSVFNTTYFEPSRTAMTPKMWSHHNGSQKDESCTWIWNSNIAKWWWYRNCFSSIFKIALFLSKIIEGHFRKCCF